MKINKSTDPTVKPYITMLIYGHGGVGKTTAAATAPHAILADFEGGSKYFGLRGIEVDVAMIQTWKDVQDLYSQIKKSNYETVIIDPIGEAMEKLTNDMIEKHQTKLVQADGQPTMAGWGYLKDNMRRFVKSFRDMNKHLILVAHVDERADDEGSIKKRPMIKTKLAQELINMVDIVAYMEVVKDKDGEEKRIFRIQPNSDKYEAKDRTGQLGEIVPPDFKAIINAIQGNAKFAWAKAVEKKADDNQEAFEKNMGDGPGVNPPAATATPPAKKPIAPKPAEPATPNLDDNVLQVLSFIRLCDTDAELDEYAKTVAEMDLSVVQKKVINGAFNRKREELNPLNKMGLDNPADIGEGMPNGKQ